MTRLLLVHPSDELYGADRVALIVSEVAASRCEVEVWLPTDIEFGDRPLSRELNSRGVAVDLVDFPVLRRAYLTPRMIPTLLRRVRVAHSRMVSVNPDLVYINTSASLAVARSARRNGARTVFHLHEHWTAKERALLGWTLRYCDVIIAVSEAVRTSLPAAHARRARTIPNGFDLLEPPAAEGHRRRVDFRLAESDIVVLLASRWNAWKGHESFLAAWDQVDRDDLKLVILGGPPASGQSFDVECAVKALRHPERVRLVGEVSDALGWISASDVVAIPSIRPDPLPTIAIEAAGIGRAVIASADGGLPDIVVDGVTGLLLPPLDQKSWVDALTVLDPATLRSQGLAARPHFESHFSRESFDRRLTAVLSEALDRG